MKKQKLLNEKVLKKLRKEAAQVEKLQLKAIKAIMEIEEIEKENKWLSYLGEDFYKESKQEQGIELFDLHDKIRTAKKEIRIAL